jgi:hypothetical protein
MRDGTEHEGEPARLEKKLKYTVDALAQVY